ncbi:MAG: YARHG domain-containing protein [Bacteroidota bacterium]|nr:YARHG domain-containing protein [Bacteroidota bacterium]
MAYCTKCGKQNTDTARFCTTCGAVLKIKTSPPTIASSSAAHVDKKPSNPWKIISIVALIGFAVAGYFLFFNKNNNDKVINSHETDKKGENADNPSEKRDTINQTLPINKSTISSTPGRFPQSSERLLTNSDLMGLNLLDLKIMRNEIYARHGFIFQKDDMRQFFNSQSWYRPLYVNVDNLLTSVEKSNIHLIKDFER